MQELATYLTTLNAAGRVNDEVRTLGIPLVQSLTANGIAHRQVGTVMGISPSTVSAWRNRD